MTEVLLGHLYQYIVNLSIYTKKVFVACDFTYIQQYSDHMGQGPLKELAMRCLDDDPVRRPSILHVFERINAVLKRELWI